MDTYNPKVPFVGSRYRSNLKDTWWRDFRVNTDWLWEHYPDERRYASMIFLADNVLVPEVIQTMYSVHKEIEAIRTAGKYYVLCTKYRSAIVSSPEFLVKWDFH